MSINLHGVVPSVKLKNKLRLLDQFDITEVFHCDGLLLLCSSTSQYESKIMVWNPLTGQTRWIEVINVCKNNRRFVLGYSQATKSCSKSYKILSFTNDCEESEIYEFNSDSWRSIHDVDSIVCSDQNVSLKGNIYWFAHEKGIHLLRFDFSTEKTSASMTLPYHCKTYETLSVSVVREEKLCVLLKRNDTSKTEIWVTNKIDETKDVSWSKVLALYLSPDLQISESVNFLFDEEKKVVVCYERLVYEEETCNDKIYIIVGDDNNKVTTVDFGVSEACWPVILTYVPSLVQI